MPRPKPTTTYRSLFADAARTAWNRKPLWVFGLFAALLSTGGAYEMTAKYTHRVSAAGDLYGHVLHGTFAGTRAFGGYVQDVLRMEPARVSGTLTLLIVLAALAIAASVVSQGALVAGTGSKKPVSDAVAAEVGRWAFWDLLGLNVLNKTAHALIALVSALPLILAIARPDATNVFAAVLTFLVTFPLTIAVATLFMLASVHLVETGGHALDAIHGATEIFRRHWLAAAETGIACFVAIAVAGTAFGVSAALASIPFAIVVSLAVLTGSSSLFLAVNLVAAAVFLLLIFAFAGMATTFQYAVWVRFYELTSGRQGVMLSKIHRLWHGK